MYTNGVYIPRGTIKRCLILGLFLISGAYTRGVYTKEQKKARGLTHATFILSSDRLFMPLFCNTTLYYKQKLKKCRFKQSLKAFPGFCNTALYCKAFILLFTIETKTQHNRNAEEIPPAGTEQKRSGSDRAIWQPCKNLAKITAYFKAVFRPFKSRLYFMNN